MMVADMAVVVAAAGNGVDGGRQGGRGREGEQCNAEVCFVFCPALSYKASKNLTTFQQTS
jgi:hypothetical protein